MWVGGQEQEAGDIVSNIDRGIIVIATN